ncbi:hypothetical protein ACTVZO_00265 [Streptomyces sp. IBSNAI002]|uniref:hypothetical protein n=1 Tax=Streptomyces sp. IBSNAI002 TaxID=3457500 RepID=UPI003FD25CB1
MPAASPGSSSRPSTATSSPAPSSPGNGHQVANRPLRAVADLAAAVPDESQILSMATDVECVFHGRSSGLDVCAVAHVDAIWFEPGLPPRTSPLPVAAPLSLIIALTPRRTSTAARIAALRMRVDFSSPTVRPAMDALGKLTCQAHSAVVHGDPGPLGLLMDQAQSTLQTLGLSTPELDRGIAVARAAGAAGAKLTGAGGGGALIALAQGPDQAPQIEAALKDAGFIAFTTTPLGRIDQKLTGSRPPRRR